MDVPMNSSISSGRKLVLLAATTDIVPSCFRRADVDPIEHERLLTSAQKLRGSVYLADGAIKESDLGSDGRFATKLDHGCWHFLIVDESGEVRGCLRYRPMLPSVKFEDLGLSRCELARDPEWGFRLRRAVEADIAIADTCGMQYVEFGGWAVSEALRGTPESLRLVLTCYALARESGGGVGIVNATRRHHSAQILRRVGGESLTWQGTRIPPYFDSRYGCEMEILRFNINSMKLKHSSLVDLMSEQLPDVRVVIGRHSPEKSLERLWQAVALAGHVAANREPVRRTL